MQLPADAFNCLFQTSPSSHCHGFANPLSTYVVTMFWTIRFGCDSKWLTFILRWINGTNHQFCGFLAVHLWSSDQNILPHPSFLPGIATTAKTWTMGRHLWWFFDQQNTEGIGLNKTIQVIQNWICLQLTMCQPENVAAFVCFMPKLKRSISQMKCTLFRAMQTQPFLRTRPVSRPNRIAAVHGHMHVAA